MKRFTETTIWSDPWYRKLSKDSKLAFKYITDNCDCAGVWNADFGLADFSIGGTPLDWSQVLEDFGTKRIKVIADDKWMLIGFIPFQYGKLSEHSKPHLAVLRQLEKHGIIGYGKGMDTLEEKEKDKEKAKEKEKDKDSIAQIYAAYPRKVAPRDAHRAIEKALQNTPAVDLLAAVVKYAEAVAQWSPEDRGFIPYPATWFNKERYREDPQEWVKVRKTNNRIGAVTSEDYARGF